MWKTITYMCITFIYTISITSVNLFISIRWYNIMKRIKYIYQVCSKGDNGVWFSSKDKQECIEYISISSIKCQESPYHFYIRKIRIS